MSPRTCLVLRYGSQSNVLVSVPSTTHGSPCGFVMAAPDVAPNVTVAYEYGVVRHIPRQPLAAHVYGPFDLHAYLNGRGMPRCPAEHGDEAACWRSWANRYVHLKSHVSSCQFAGVMPVDGEEFASANWTQLCAISHYPTILLVVWVEGSKVEERLPEAEHLGCVRRSVSLATAISAEAARSLWCYNSSVIVRIIAEFKE